MKRAAIAGIIARNGQGRQLLEWWQHRRTDVYLLSYPKCGRTWLRLMIGKALDEHYGIGASNPMDLAGLSAREPRIPRIRVRHDLRWWSASVDRHQDAYRSKTVIFLVRDPRDVVVSMYFNATKRQQLNDEEQRQHMFQGDLSAFLDHPVGGLDQIIGYYNMWAENRSLPALFHMVRYEDLHRDAGEALRAVLDAMRVQVGKPAIERAVEFGRFENMRKLERTDALGSHSLRAADNNDADSFKTRQGKVGGYRQYMSAEDLVYVNRRINRHLSNYYACYKSDASEASEAGDRSSNLADPSVAATSG
jgi:Sulfotransferase domain